MSNVAQQKEQAARVKEEGNTAYQAGEYARALELYNRAVELDPNNPTFRFNRAAAYMQLGMFQKCVEDCQWAIEITPNVAKYHLRKGRAYEKLGQMYEARISYQNGLRNDPGNAEIQAALQALPPPDQCRTGISMEERRNRAVEWKEKGNAAYTARKWREAVDAYTKAIEFDPSDMIFFNNRAACELELREFDKAVEDAKKATEIGKATRAAARLLAKAHARLGEAYRCLNRNQDAAAAYRASLSEEDSEQIRQKLAEVTRS